MNGLVDAWALLDKLGCWFIRIGYDQREVVNALALLDKLGCWCIRIGYDQAEVSALIGYGQPEAGAWRISRGCGHGTCAAWPGNRLAVVTENSMVARSIGSTSCVAYFMVWCMWGNFVCRGWGVVAGDDVGDGDSGDGWM